MTNFKSIRPEGLLPILIGLLGFYMFIIQFFHWDFSRIPGDFGDARLNNFILEHGYRYLTGKENSYWDAPFMYPDTKTITYSDNHLATLPIYSALRLMGLDRELSFQWWIIVLVILNYCSGYFCFRKMKFNIPLSSAAAYIFSFSSIIIGKAGHAQLLALFFIPWVFYFLIEFYKKNEFKFFIYSLLLIVAQIYCGFYIGLLTVVIFQFLLVGILLKKTTLLKSIFPGIKPFLLNLLGLILVFLLLLPLAIPYHERAILNGYKSYENIKPMLLSFRNFLMPMEGTLLWKKLNFMNYEVQFNWEKQLWVGGFLFVLFFYYLGLRVFGVVRSRGLHFLLFMTIILSLLLFVNWGEGFSFFKYYRLIPGFSALTPISRIILPILFLLALLILYLVRAFFIKHKIPYLFYYLFVVLVILDQGVRSDFLMNRSYDKKLSQIQINKIIETAKVNASNKIENYKALAYIPDSSLSPTQIQIAAALAAQQLGIPSVNGFSSNCQTLFGPFWQKHDSASLQNWLQSNNLDIIKSNILIVK